MNTANITRAEAADRSQKIEVKSYEVELDLHPDAETFRSTTTVRFEATATDTWLDLIAPRLISVTLNDKSIPISDFDGFRIQLTDLQDANVVDLSAPDGEIRSCKIRSSCEHPLWVLHTWVFHYIFTPHDVQGILDSALQARNDTSIGSQKS